MAVYTKITKTELEQHLCNYEIGGLIDFHEIVEGIDNSNYIIKTSTGKYIFTIFESRIDKEILPYFVNLKQHLSSKNISCPKPISNKSGNKITDFKNKKTIIVTFLEGSSLKPHLDGYYYNITPNNCLQIGEILAKMHVASQDFVQFRYNDLGVDGFEKLYQKFSHLLADYDKTLVDLIPQEITNLKALWNPNLQSSACHLDLFPDNVFFKDGKISAVIDFYFSANDLQIYDFAIIVNAWCFDKHSFNHQKFISIVNGYQSIKPFTKSELEFLPTALKCASMRFLITRLNDYFFTPKNSLVKIKDPQEYKQKLLFFLQNKL
ncbi:MAG: homoserine kinase [Alphaproteobacteria bacterium]|nr:homoserine kinase [Alphaproteobacteria bacterium]